MTAREAKAQLRAAMRERRRLAAAKRDGASSVIARRLLVHPAVTECLAAGGVIAAYLASPQEIDLGSFIDHALRSGAPVAVPRWDGVTYGLSRLRSRGEEWLRRGPMNIAEPIAAEPVAPEAVAVWLVPGLAFTRDGGRLGYGGGWYDRLLAAASPRAATLGIAYGFQVVDELPTESHDIRLSGLVTAD